MKPALPSLLRMIAILLWIGGVVLGMLDAYGAARTAAPAEESLASRLPAVAEAVAMVLGLAGLGMVTYSIAEMIGTEPGTESKRALSELRHSMQRLESAVQRLSDQQREAMARGPGSFG
jgi:phage shock protein PspC (stress-responsive transcriptional regulator)